MHQIDIPIGGNPSFLANTRSLLFGKALLEKIPPSKITTIQSLSGTGALSLFAHYAFKFSSKTSILVPNPTWGNHRAIFENAGLTVSSYTYLDPTNPRQPRIDFLKTLNEVKAAPSGTIILLHACAHNPTGVDFSPVQWKELLTACKNNDLFCCFDNAYQGFATGDLDVDAQAVRLAVEMEIPMFCCCSFAKNLGLYGERVGALHYYGSNAVAVLSQLKLIARAT